MFTSAGFTKQPDGSWYVPDSTVLNNKVLWENTEGIAGPLIISLYGKSPQPNAADIMQFLVTFTDGDIRYINGTGSSDVWKYSVPIVPNPTKTIAKIDWVNITGRPLYLRDVMFEWGSTPTPYTPYNYLQSNKRLIKVSNVCQLYAKNIWKEYTDLYGVSIKNNNDGSITLNGTATETFFYTNRLDYEIKPNHKYLYVDYYPQTPSWDTYVGGCEGKVNHESIVTFAVYSLNNDGTIASSSPTLPSNTLLNTFCMIYKGFTLNNVTIKPQLFDLTEMYGAGHEPATVAEFRQKFSDELYPYSPQCWLTSYQSAVICKTKNLFDYKTSDEKTQTNNGITLILNTDYFELSGQQQVGKYIELGQSGFNIPFEIGKTYVLSADTIVKSGGKVFMRARYTDGESPLTEWETVSWNLFNGTIAKRFTPTRPGYFDKITFYNSGDTIPISGDYIIRIQIEQGSTETSYVPYQHL